MATNLCSNNSGNTGGVDCGTKRVRPTDLYVGGKAFTSSEYADADTFEAALIAAHKLNDGNTAKLVKFPSIAQVAINTPASTTGNLPFGPVRRLIKGLPSYTYTVEVTWMEYQKLLAWDGKKVPVFTKDENGNIWGYRAGAAANTINTKNFTGELAYVTIEGSGFEDGQNAESGQAKINVSFLSVDDFEKRGTYVATTDFSSSDVKGLTDLMLSEAAVHSTNVYKIKVSIPLPKAGPGLDTYDDYAAILATLSAQFTAFTGTTFQTPLTITSVAVDSALKALTVTFDSTMFTALAALAKIKLYGPTVAQLDTAGIEWKEIQPIILTK